MNVAVSTPGETVPTGLAVPSAPPTVTSLDVARTTKVVLFGTAVTVALALL